MCSVCVCLCVVGWRVEGGGVPEVVTLSDEKDSGTDSAHVPVSRTGGFVPVGERAIADGNGMKIMGGGECGMVFAVVVVVIMKYAYVHKVVVLFGFGVLFSRHFLRCERICIGTVCLCV